MALVLSVIAVSIRLGSMLNVDILGSTNTGVAPTYVTASAVAMYVFEGTITSSPSPIPKALSISISASRPFPTPTQYFVLQNSAKAFSNA